MHAQHGIGHAGLGVGVDGVVAEGPGQGHGVAAAVGLGHGQAAGGRDDAGAVGRPHVHRVGEQPHVAQAGVRGVLDVVHGHRRSHADGCAGLLVLGVLARGRVAEQQRQRHAVQRVVVVAGGHIAAGVLPGFVLFARGVGQRAGHGEGEQAARDVGARGHAADHVDVDRVGHRAVGLVEFADDRARPALGAVDGHGDAHADGLALGHAAGPVDLRFQAAGVDVHAPAGDGGAGVQVRQRVAALLEVAEGAAHSHLAGAGAGLAEGEAHDGLLGLHVEARLLAAVQGHAVFDDGVRGVVDELQEQRAAHAALAAAVGRGADVELGLGVVVAVLPGRDGRVQLDAGEAEAEAAGHVHDLHVVGGLDGHHMLVDVVGVGAALDGVIGAGAGPVVRVLVDLHAGLHPRLGHVVHDQQVDRTRDGHAVGRGGGARPAVEQAVQPELAAQVAVDEVQPFAGDLVAQLAGRQRDELVGAREEGVGDAGDDAQRAQRVELGAGLDGDTRIVVRHAHDQRDAGAVLGRGVGRGLALVVLLAGLFFAGALGLELQLLGDARDEFHVVVGLQVGGAGDQRLHPVFAVREGQRPGHLQAGLRTARRLAATGVGAARVLVLLVVVGGRVEDVVEDAAAPVEAAVLVVLRVVHVLLGEAGLGRDRVGGLEVAAHAEGHEGGVQDLRGAEGVAHGGRARQDVADLHARDAAARLVFQRAQLDGLLAGEALVAAEVELVGARHHVVAAAVAQVLAGAEPVGAAAAQQRHVQVAVQGNVLALPVELAVGTRHHLVGVGPARLAVDNGLAQFEGVEHQAAAVQGDDVVGNVAGLEGVGVGGAGIAADQAVAQIDHVGVQPAHPALAQRHFPGVGLHGLVLGLGQLDVAALVGGGVRVVGQAHDDVGLAGV